jgi:succinyl-CoA synthetase beta subunit
MARLYEYQSKQILKKFGVSVPYGIVAYNADEAYEAAKK